MAPADLSRLIIDCLDHSLTPHPIVGSSPSVCTIGRLRKVDTPAWVCIHNKQTCLGIEARSAVIRESALIRRDQTAIGRRFLRGIRNRMSFLIDPQSP